MKKPVPKLHHFEFPALVFFSILALSADSLCAQGLFFKEYQADSIGMSSEQLTRYTALQNPATSASVKIVRSADIRQQSDTIAFCLPGQTDTLLAEASMITDDSLAGFSWSGKLLNELGYLSLAYRNGAVGGFAQIGSKFYELMPLDTVYQFFVERNNGHQIGCGMPPDSVSPPPGPGNKCTLDSIAVYDTCPAVVSVLLVLTQGGKDWVVTNFGSIDTYVAICQLSVNLAFYNSDIPNKVIRIKWIEHLDIQDSLRSPTNIDYDRNHLPAWIGSDRSSNGADIAVLLTDQGYGNVAGAVTGIGPVDSTAFAIVEAPFAISRFTLAHELGHLWGCHHNWKPDWGDDNTAVCAHAKRWWGLPQHLEDLGVYFIHSTWSTIVGTPVPFTPKDGLWLDVPDPESPGDSVLININYTGDSTTDFRILHYSNPDVLFGTEPTGRATGFVADNARFIRTNACTVAGFFPSKELSVLVSYPKQQPCLDTTLTVTANIQSPPSGQGQGPYTVYWYWSPTAINHSNLGSYLGTGVSHTFEGYPHCPVFWLRCVVSSSDGVTVSTIQKVVVGPASCCTTGSEGEGDGHRLAGTPADSYILFPNPVSRGLLSLIARAHKETMVDYRISDIGGRILVSTQAATDSGGRLQVNVASLPAGLYFLKVLPPSGERLTFKFIIAQN